MLITDFTKFTSDNPADGYKELHDFAQSIGYDKGWHYNHKGVHYYLCRNNMTAKAALRMHQSRIVSVPIMKRILYGTYKKTFQRDFRIYSFKKRCVRYLMATCEAAGIKIRRSEVQMKVCSSTCKAKYWDMYISVLFQVSETYPQGRVTLTTLTGTRDLEIPQSVVDEIDSLNRPVPKGKTIIKK